VSIPTLDHDALFAADRAYLDAQAEGRSQARCVRAALLAYVETLAAPQIGVQSTGESLTQVVATLPVEHPDLPGGQVLVRSFDRGVTWEVCTRPDTHSTWSRGIDTVTA
jgi:hypothetical protein